MLDRSQDSAHPLRSLAPDERVLRDGLVTRWPDFYDLLVADPAKKQKAVQSSADGTRTPVMSGTPAELIAAGEAAGAGVSPWAVIAPVRREIQIVDVDRCADRVLTPILEAAAEVGATLAHLAASGSANSVHIGVTLPTEAAHTDFLRRVAEIREWAGETSSTVAVFTPNLGLRLPGSASLKPGGAVCWPIDTDGRRITALAAVQRLREALDRPCVDTSPPLPSPTDATPIPVDDIGPDAELAVVAPRAYRAPTRMTAEQFKILQVAPSQGDRSDAALAGGWVLWRLGIRSWRAAARYYEIHPCFVKWRERDAEERARGHHLRPGWVPPCKQHWKDITRRARAHRPKTAPLHAPQIAAALAEVAQWDDPDLVAAAVAVIQHRFADGYGLTRPAAVRDFTSWLGLSEATSSRRRQKLVDRGLLTVEKEHDRKTAAHEATVFKLTTPHPVYRSSVKHDVTAGGIGVILHPVWVELGQAARLVFSHLSATPLSSAQLSAVTGTPVGGSRHGLVRLLHLLAENGLATRIGTGRATAWAIGPTKLDDAAAALTGRTAREEAQARVILDRDVWHARSHYVAGQALRRRRRALSDRRRVNRPASAATQLELVYSRRPGCPTDEVPIRRRRTARPGLRTGPGTLGPSAAPPPR